MSPRVSIAIPAYRPGALFRATLRSCLEQDYPDLEVVVALDGEDPEVEAAVAEAGDPRVRLLADGQRRGQFGNFNRAVDEARGELVKLFSADDLMGRDCVRRMVEALDANPGLGLCAARHLAFSSDAAGRIAPRLDVPVGGAAPVVALPPEAARWYLALHGNQVGGPSNVMLRRSAWWASGGFDPRIGHLGDIAYWNRVARRVGLVIVERPLVGYRIHDNSVTGRDALSLVRITEPFAIADDATPGAWFPGSLWRERVVRQLLGVDATVGYALSMLRRSPRLGLAAVARVLLGAGLVLSPLAAAVAAWSLLRSRLLGARGPSFLRSPLTYRGVEVGPVDERAVVELLSDPSALARLVPPEVRP